MNDNNYVDINAHDNYPDSEQTINVPTMKVIPLKKICMTIGELPTSYLETMTYYEMLVWFIEYLKNNIIPTVNNNAEAVQEVQGVVLDLQTYINNFKDSIDSDVEELEEYMNNYFENLDVQEEINNKLDAMVEAGTLQEIITDYLNSKAIFGFDNVASMISATNLIDGSYAKTLGYYEKNDGGKGLYKIREITNEDVIDNGSIISINDNLIAELIYNSYITPEQIGAKCDGINDDSEYLLTAFNLAKNNKLKLVLDKNYYINDSITLDGENNTINIEEIENSLKIDGQIVIKNINYSTIILKLNEGGTGDINTYGVIFQKLKQCELNLQANNVNKTAFYINSEKTPNNIEVKFCNVIIRGNYNLRTLLHGSSNSSLGDGFGTYIDISDGNFTHPIKFINCRDVNILHYENFIDDSTYTKNSLEFINAGIRSSLMCLGGKCKNLLYMEDSKLSTDFMLLINEQTGASVSTDYQLTGVYIKGNSEFSANHINSAKCLYTIDAHEMTNQSLLVVQSTFITFSSPAGRGIYLPDIAGNELILKFNYEERCKNIPISSENEHVDVSHLNAEKLQNQVHINGYITIDSDIPYNSNLFSLSSNEDASYISYGFMRQSANSVLISQVSQDTHIIKNLNGITLATGANLWIDMTYKTKKN